MHCISCGNKSLVEYSKDSYMKLPIYFCNFCGMYITGGNEEEVKNRVIEMYKKEYWERSRGSNKDKLFRYQFTWEKKAMDFSVRVL